MHPRALVDIGSELLREVLRFQAPADALIAAHLRHHRALGPRERHVLAETLYDVIRRRRWLEHLARGGPGTMERRLMLLAFAGSPSVRDAACTDAERQWVAERLQITPPTAPSVLMHHLPEWLAAPLRERLGEPEFLQLADALQQQAPLDLRVNVLKARRDEVQQALTDVGIPSAPTPYSPWGLRVAGKPALHGQPVFVSGQVEVQDEGSQLLAALTGATRSEMVVDFCAGAGGKTLALGAMMRGTGRLYAFDTSAKRLDALRPRLARSGLQNVHTAQLAHERDDRVRRLAGKVDRVLVDAPCSGTGTLRRSPDLKWRHGAEDVTRMAALQRQILTAASRLLRPGGRLVYATCSLLEAENEAVAAAFDAAAAPRQWQRLDVAMLLEGAGCSPEAAAELTVAGDLRLWPHRHATDGFYAAAWQRL